jgi:hypothetical protein
MSPFDADAGPRETAAPDALVSVHDLMPATMPAVRRTLALLEDLAIHPVTLLVVPGSGWDTRGVDELRSLARAGYRLAGHGWRHRAERIRGLRHRLHSVLLSRRVAEHLALDRHEIAALLQRCRAWFAEHGLPAPELYVPPAWAMGDLDAATVRQSGFRYVEGFGGVLDAVSGRIEPSPVLGYEADAALRVPVLRLWNSWGRRRAARLGRVRIGIHPQDIDHPLRGDLIADLERYRNRVDYPSALWSALGGTATG